MAYVTYEQYVAIYGTCPISEQQFPFVAGIASDLIDGITQYRIEKGGGIAAFPPFVQTLIQKAAAAQVLYFSQIGLETALTGQTGQSFTVGKVSVNGGALSGSNGTPGSLMISPQARALLEQTGLMRRGVVTCSRLFRNAYWPIP